MVRWESARWCVAGAGPVAAAGPGRMVVPVAGLRRLAAFRLGRRRAATLERGGVPGLRCRGGAGRGCERARPRGGAVARICRSAALRLRRKRAATARWECARRCVAEVRPVVAAGLGRAVVPVAGLVVAGVGLVVVAGAAVRWCGWAHCSIGFVMSCSPPFLPVAVVALRSSACCLQRSGTPALRHSGTPALRHFSVWHSSASVFRWCRARCTPLVPGSFASNCPRAGLTDRPAREVHALAVHAFPSRRPGRITGCPCARWCAEA